MGESFPRLPVGPPSSACSYSLSHDASLPEGVGALAASGNKAMPLLSTTLYPRGNPPPTRWRLGAPPFRHRAKWCSQLLPGVLRDIVGTNCPSLSRTSLSSPCHTGGPLALEHARSSIDEKAPRRPSSAHRRAPHLSRICRSSSHAPASSIRRLQRRRPSQCPGFERYHIVSRRVDDPLDKPSKRRQRMRLLLGVGVPVINSFNTLDDVA